MMALVALLRVLWRRRLVVLIGALLAILVVAIGIQRRAGAPATISSLTKVLIDTPESLVASAQAPGAGTINPRARLVAGLVASDDAKAAIARQAGLQPTELAIAGPGAAAPPRVITPLAEQAIEVAKPTEAYLVSVEVAAELPILSIDAHAPDRDQAVGLGQAVIQTLPSIAREAPGGGSSVAIEQLGKPLVMSNPASGGKVKVLGAALVFFIFWCLGCIFLDRLLSRRSLRQLEWHDIGGAWR